MRIQQGTSRLVTVVPQKAMVRLMTSPLLAPYHGKHLQLLTINLITTVPWKPVDSHPLNFHTPPPSPLTLTLILPPSLQLKPKP